MRLWHPRLVATDPALGVEGIGFLERVSVAEDVCGNQDDDVLVDDLAGNRAATFRDDTGEACGEGEADADGFFDAGLEVEERRHYVINGDLDGAGFFVEFGAEAGEHGRVLVEEVDGVGQGGSGGVGAGVHHDGALGETGGFVFVVDEEFGEDVVFSVWVAEAFGDIVVDDVFVVDADFLVRWP